MMLPSKPPQEKLTNSLKMWNVQNNSTSFQHFFVASCTQAMKKKNYYTNNTKKELKLKSKIVQIVSLFFSPILDFFFLLFFHLLSLTPFQFTHIFISLKLKSDWSKTNIIKLDTKYEHKTSNDQIKFPHALSLRETQIDFRENGKIARERKCNFDRVTYIWWSCEGSMTQQAAIVMVNLQFKRNETKLIVLERNLIDAFDKINRHWRTLIDVCFTAQLKYLHKMFCLAIEFIAHQTKTEENHYL